MVLALTSKAAARLSAQFRGRSVEKKYLALVQGGLPPSGSLEGSLIRDGRLTRPALASEAGIRAALRFRRLPGRMIDGSPARLAEIELLTGARHQIRAQMAAIGHPVVGDALYGARPAPPGEPAIGLWSFRLAFDHPVSGERLVCECPPPAIWPFSLWEGERGF
jgi:23S rRNA-/tRNA-specific pseudouridylate synthase